MLKRVFALLCCTLLFGVFSLTADEWNKKTIVTFNQPVELPGIVLPAGTYVFKLLDSQSDRHIVQVFNKGENKIYTTILAIPNYRLEPTGDTIMKFAERPANLPDALRAWFYPGDNFGQEFVYPKVRAGEIAAETKAPVLAAAVPPAAKPEELTAIPVETIPAPAPVVVPAPVVAEAPAPVAEPAPRISELPVVPVELPKTASRIPLVGLLGAISIGLALLLRRTA